MASLVIMVLALLGLITTGVTVNGATTAPKTRTQAAMSSTLEASDTTDVNLPTTNLTTASWKVFGSKTPAAAPATTTVISVTTATTSPLRFLRPNRNRSTRATSSTTSLPLEAGSSSSVHKGSTVPLELKSKNGRQRYDRPEEYVRVPENPRFYSHSKRMSYSSSTGSSPRFSSSEEYFHLPLDEVLGSESEISSNVDNGGEGLQMASKRSSSGESKGSRRDCRMMHKPMPDYLEYTGKESGQEKPMMTCYVCGKKDAPFSDSGYTEDCDVSPTNQKDVYANRDDYDTPKGKATKSHGKLYAGDGQSPYLTGAENNEAGRTGQRHHNGNVNVQDDYDPYYGNDGDDSYYGEGGGNGGAYPQATDSNGAVYDGSDNDGGSSEGYNDGAETDKSSCKVVYKGKMKCRVCGDPKEGGAFDEQCDYEQDAPEQHHSRAYDYSSNNEKKYRSKPHRGSRGGGGHDDGYGGYGDGDYHGSDSYPRYDNYGAGTGYDPDYGNTAPVYDDGYGDERDTGYQKRNGRDSFQSREQPEASTTISDKKDVDLNESKKKNCKVTYKDVTSSYSPYDTKKKKPKMKCMVCNGEGGVTEECSYNGAGELTASFPGSSGPSDISSFFDRDSVGDHSFYNPIDFDGFQDLFF